MKKLLSLLTLLSLICNTAFCSEDLFIKEGPCSLKDLTKDQYDQVKKDREHQEQLQQNMEQQGLDYMYRMQQQIIMPQNMNPYGGYRF